MYFKKYFSLHYKMPENSCCDHFCHDGAKESVSSINKGATHTVAPPSL